MGATERSRKWREANREQHARSVHLAKVKKKYGLDKEAYETLIANATACEICGTDKPGGRGTWHIDHDHEMPGDPRGVRGVLCSTCNRGLGMFGDDPDRLEAAANYLRKHSSPQSGN